jgi:hypothetical protein
MRMDIYLGRGGGVWGVLSFLGLGIGLGKGVWEGVFERAL